MMAGLLTRAVNARAVAVARIGVGLGAIAKGAIEHETLIRIASPQYVAVPYVDAAPPLTAAAVAALMVVWYSSAALFTIGLFTRAAGLVLTLVLGVTLLADQQLWSNNLYLLFWSVLLLSLARPGSALSVDARGKEVAEAPYWPVLLLKYLVSVMYLFAGLSKVNPQFLSGEILSTQMMGAWLLPTWVIVALSVATVALEISLPFLLWSVRWHHHAIAAGFLLHASFPVMLFGDLSFELSVFSLISISSYVFFLDPERHSRIVVWDAECSFCRVWVRWFARLDWMQVHRFVPNQQPALYAGTGITQEDADHAIQLAAPGGNASAFAAVRSIAEHLPVTMFLAPVLRLPPIAAAGERAYAQVAARRTCALGTVGAAAAGYETPVRGN